MPRKDQTPPKSMPRTLPLVVSTTGKALASIAGAAKAGAATSPMPWAAASIKAERPINSRLVVDISLSPLLKRSCAARRLVTRRPERLPADCPKMDEAPDFLFAACKRLSPGREKMRLLALAATALFLATSSFAQTPQTLQTPQT